MTTETVKLGLTKATYGELPGTWDGFERQDRDRLEDRLTTQFAGNPNLNVVGYWEGQRCTDTTNNKLYICSATGSASLATWQEIGVYGGFISAINALTALTTLATDDIFPVWDLSASGNRGITVANALGIITALTQLTASDTDLSNDKIFLYDASASQMKYGIPQNFTGIDPIAYSARALSASQSFALNSVITFTHGLGAQAKGAQTWYKNISTEGAYVAGDLLLANPWYDSVARGVATIIDSATEVKAVVGPGSIANLIKKDGTGSFVLTASNWALVIEAWT